jgi:diaminopimelate decarboxylase
MNHRLQLDAASFPGTPAFIYDPECVIARYSALRSAIARPLIVSMKANFDVNLFSRIATHFVDGIELASIGELRRAVGRYKGTKYLNAPALQTGDWAAAAASGCVSVLNSQDQLDALLSLKLQGKRLGAILVRLHAASLVGRDWDWRRDDHFGVTPEQAVVMCKRAAAHDVWISGFHVFSGSNTFPTGVTQLLAPLRALIDVTSEHCQKQGGMAVLVGLGLPDDGIADIRLQEVSREAQRILGSHDLRFECGRAIFANSGSFVTRVISVKQLQGQLVVACDGGLPQAFLLARTESLTRPLQRPRVYPLDTLQEKDATRHRGGIFVGPSCNRQDVIGLLNPDATLPHKGDLVVFDNVGAYVSTYAPTAFLCSATAETYLVN